MPARRTSPTVALSRLAEVRVEKGVTQEELAGVIGISVRSLARLEKHQLATPSLKWYVNIAMALDVEREDLFDHWEKRWHRLHHTAPHPPEPGWIDAVKRQRSARHLWIR